MELTNKNTKMSCSYNFETLDLKIIEDMSHKISSFTEPIQEREFKLSCDLGEYVVLEELLREEFKFQMTELAKEGLIGMSGGIKKDSEGFYLEPIKFQKVYLPNIGSVDINVSKDGE